MIQILTKSVASKNPKITDKQSKILKDWIKESAKKMR